MVFEMFERPYLAVQNFKMLCSGEGGVGRAGKPLCYKGVPVHRIIPVKSVLKCHACIL